MNLCLTALGSRRSSPAESRPARRRRLVLPRFQSVAILFALLASLLERTQAADVAIQGRVLDQKEGTPLAHVDVKAYAAAMGQAVWSAQGDVFSSRTDEQGRFAIQVPGPELDFMVLAEGLGGSTSKHVISGETGEIELRLGRDPSTSNLAGSVFDLEDAPAAGLEIELLGEYGVRQTARTDPNGAFRFANLPGFGQGVVLASRNSTVLAQVILRASSPPSIYRLVPAATLQGQAVEAASGLPLAGIRVTIRPWFSSDFRLSTQSDTNGAWIIRGIPPGDYLVEAAGPDHFDPDPPTGIRAGDPKQRIRLASDATVSNRNLLTRKASLNGVVRTTAGEPVEGALIATAQNPNGARPEFQEWTRTDRSGRFTVQTSHLNNRMALNVFDSTWGLRLVTVEPLAAGEHRLIEVPPLPGSVRIKGTVVDETGKGIAGIMLVPPNGSWNGLVSTDEGKFDLGRVSLPEAGQEFTVGFQTPRPGYPGMSKGPNDTIWRTGQGHVAGRTYYLETQTSLRPKHNQEIDLKVALKPAELLVLRGKILEPAGQPPVNGQVFLFSGTAEEDWARRTLPDLIGGGGWFEKQNWLGGAECNPDGVFAIYVLRNDGEKTPAGTRFSLGIAVNGQPRKLETGLVVPLEQTELSLEIKLAPPPPAPLDQPRRGTPRPNLNPPLL